MGGRKYFNIVISVFFIILLFLLTSCKSSNLPESFNINNAELANPAAVYCEKLGYNYEIINSEEGSQGICKFNIFNSCPGWAFFNGECGQKFTFCEKKGGDIEVSTNDCRFNSKCAICITKEGNECMEWDYFIGECNK